MNTSMSKDYQRIIWIPSLVWQWSWYSKIVFYPIYVVVDLTPPMVSLELICTILSVIVKSIAGVSDKMSRKDQVLWWTFWDPARH